MSIRSQWKRLKSWDDEQRWGKFTEDGWVHLDRTRRQLADSLRSLPVSEATVSASTAAAVATSEID